MSEQPSITFDEDCKIRVLDAATFKQTQSLALRTGGLSQVQDQAADLLLSGGAGRNGCLRSRSELACELLEYCDLQARAIAEVVVHQGGLDAGPPRDLPEGQPTLPLLGHHLAGGLEQGLASLDPV